MDDSYNYSIEFGDFGKTIFDSVLEACFCSDLGYISLIMKGWKDDNS